MKNYIGLTNELLKFYDGCMSTFYNINLQINFDSEIGAKTKNVIFYIRNLMIEQKQIIFDKVNFIDKNYNDIENTKKMAELNDLLMIENQKIDNANLNEIEVISKNISNLRNILAPLKFNFEMKTKNEKILKIQFANIFLFLENTNHLFPLTKLEI